MALIPLVPAVTGVFALVRHPMAGPTRPYPACLLLPDPGVRICWSSPPPMPGSGSTAATGTPP